MTEKVKLPQNVADAIEAFLTENDNNREDFINWFGVNRKYRSSMNKNYKPLADLTYSDLARALLIGYEVEPKYKVGDWVVFSDELYEVYQVVTGGMKVHIKNSRGSTITHMPIQNIRHATPEEIKAEKERRVWAGMDRNVGEFRIGDVRILDDGNSVRITDVDYARAKYIQGGLKGFFPVESFVSFEEGESE